MTQPGEFRDHRDYDYAVVGGSVVGLAVAYGLNRLGARVVVLDEGDLAFRASRGNFGLVWTQSKGLDAPHYHRWSCRSAALWHDFAAELMDGQAADLGLRQDGGYDIHLDDDSLAAQAARHERLHTALGGDHPFEILGNNALRREEPHIGPKVAGAIFSPRDGHVNPLRLLRTLAQRNRDLGNDVRTGQRIETITPRAAGGFRLTAADAEIEANRVVLCAGHGNARLGPMLGFAAPIRPERGQVMITERLAPLLRRPANGVRQVDEGAIQIGSSQEDVGFDDRVTQSTIGPMAARAIDVLPALQHARIVRTWAALRIMSPDGLPIYERSQSCPGAFLVTCHSGVTLAAAHARLIPLWLEGKPDAPDLELFSERRFAVAAAN